MKCKKCGSELKLGWKYCRRCGVMVPAGKTSRSPRKVKVIFLVAVATVAVVAIATVVVWTTDMFMSGNEMKMEAEQTVTDFLTAYQNENPAAGEYLVTSTFLDPKMSYLGFQGYLAERLTYKILGSRVSEGDGQTIFVDVEIVNIDMATLLQQFEDVPDDVNVDELLTTLSDSVQSDDVPKKTFECAVIVENYPAGMKIIMNGDLSNALFGGYNEYVFAMLESEGE